MFEAVKINRFNFETQTEPADSEGQRVEPSGKLSDFEAARMYFKEVGAETLLTAEEEIDLSAGMKECEAKMREIKAFINHPTVKVLPAEKTKLSDSIREYSTKAKKLRERFIKGNLRLVISIARRYRDRGVPLSDLIQEGNMGLMRAVEKFDHTKGYRFSTYATWWIEQAVSRALMVQLRTIKVPVSVLDKAGRVYRTKSLLSDKLKRNPSTGEVAEEVGISITAANQILNKADNLVHLDSPVVDSEGASIMELIEDENCTSPESVVADERLARAVNEALSMLTEREREVIKMRFGIGCWTTYSLDDLGDHFMLTRERIRQIEQRGLEKIKESKLSGALKSFIE